MPKLSPIDHMAVHAGLGEQLVALVRDSGLLRAKRRATRKPRAKRKAKPAAVPAPRKATAPGAVAAASA